MPSSPERIRKTSTALCRKNDRLENFRNAGNSSAGASLRQAPGFFAGIPNHGEAGKIISLAPAVPGGRISCIKKSSCITGAFQLPWRRCPELNTGIRALQGPRLSAWLHRHRIDYYSISLSFEKVKAIMDTSIAVCRGMNEKQAYPPKRNACFSVFAEME